MRLRLDAKVWCASWGARRYCCSENNAVWYLGDDGFWGQVSITPIAVLGVDALGRWCSQCLMSQAQLGSGLQCSIFSTHEPGGTIGHGAPCLSLAHVRGLLAEPTLMNWACSRRARGGAASQKEVRVPEGCGSGYSVQREMVGAVGAIARWRVCVP